MQRVILLIITTTLLQSQSMSMDKMIYGQDDRMDIYDIRDTRIKDLAAATAVQIMPKHIEQNKNKNYILNAKRMSEIKIKGVPYCSEVNFIEQKIFGQCSGFLISKNLIVTAGHCIDDKEKCENGKWVFGMNFSNSEKEIIPKESVYKCSEPIASLVYGDVDYAIIKLDRDVQNITPLKFRKSGFIEENIEIFMIGNPSGLPTKVVKNARSFNTQPGNSFNAYLDAYAGNSGSAVFNSKTNEIEGILVSGGSDFTLNKQRNCYEESKCADTNSSECIDGEGITKITSLKLDKFIEYVKNKKPYRNFQQYCTAPNGDEEKRTIDILMSKYKINKCDLLEKYLKMMTRLNLSNLKIKDLAPIAALDNIKKLYLRNNLISNVRPLLRMTSLISLKLDGNEIVKDEINCPTPIMGNIEVKLFCRIYRGISY